MEEEHAANYHKLTIERNGVDFDRENDVMLALGTSLTLRDDYENGQVTIYPDHIEAHQIHRPQ